MNRISRILGILGIASPALLLAAIAAASVSAAFSPLSAFYNELGLYAGGYFTPAPALFVNLSFVLLGLVFGALTVADALIKNTVRATALGFFGALTGVLAMAHGLFTLNVPSYHYMAASAFHLSAVVFCALFAVFGLTGRGKKPAAIIAAVLACAACGAYAVYILSGGMSAYLVAGASLSVRTGLEPFALAGWAAVVLFAAFTALYAAGMLGPRRKRAAANDAANTEDGAANAVPADGQESAEPAPDGL